MTPQSFSYEDIYYEFISTLGEGKHCQACVYRMGDKKVTIKVMKNFYKNRLKTIDHELHCLDIINKELPTLQVPHLIKHIFIDKEHKLYNDFLGKTQDLLSHHCKTMKCQNKRGDVISFSVMIYEYIEGTILINMFNLGKKEYYIVNLNFIVQFYNQMNYIVDSLHRCNIVHRDIKPANIIYMKDSDDKYTFTLIDFGSALFLDLPNKYFAGTIRYLLPKIGSGYDNINYNDYLESAIYEIAFITYVYIHNYDPRIIMIIKTENKDKYEYGTYRKFNMKLFDDINIINELNKRLS